MGCCRGGCSSEPEGFSIEFACEEESLRFWKTIPVIPAVGQHIRYNGDLYRVEQVIYDAGVEWSSVEVCYEIVLKSDQS